MTANLRQPQNLLYPPPPPTPLNKKEKIIVLATMALNFMMMYFISWQAMIIKSGPPVGMFEAIFKGLLSLTALAAFIPSIICTLSAVFSQKYGRASWWVLIILAGILFCFALLFLTFACSDELGYCRQWRLFFQ